MGIKNFDSWLSENQPNDSRVQTLKDELEKAYGKKVVSISGEGWGRDQYAPMIMKVTFDDTSEFTTEWIDEDMIEEQDVWDLFRDGRLVGDLEWEDESVERRDVWDSFRNGTMTIENNPQEKKSGSSSSQDKKVFEVIHNFMEAVTSREEGERLEDIFQQ